MTKGPEGDGELLSQDIREQVVRTRAQLADTVEELLAKTDVKAAARRKAVRARDRVQSGATNAAHTVRERAVPTLRSATGQAAYTVRSRPAPFVATGAAVVFLLAVMVRRARGERCHSC